MKTISGLYSELVKKKEKAKTFLFGSLYDFIYTRMGGNRSYTESKVLQLIRSCLLLCNIPKIRVFLRLLTIHDSEKLDGEFALYLEMLEFLDDSKSSSLICLGISLNSQDSSLVSFSRALEYVNIFMAKKGKSFN